MSLFDHPEELLTALVKVPSISGSEAELTDRIETWCSQAGLATERVGNSLIATVGRRRPGQARLLFNTHIDTVPVGAGWEGDPFGGTWSEGRLIARGSNDAKASVAAMLAAARSLQHEDLRGELIVALTCEEETTNRGMQSVLEHIGMPDGAVTGEPTGLEVVRAQSGLVVLEAHWTGRSCHAAHVAKVPYRSALLAAARATADLGGHLEFESVHPLLGQSTITPTVLVAGERHNVVPDRAELVLDARIAPPLDGAACVRRLRGVLGAADIRVRSERLSAVETPADHPLVTCALECTGKPEAIGSNTLSDMALLRGVPAIKCGPGQTRRSHTPGEYVLRQELLDGVHFYTSLAPRALAALTPLPMATGSHSSASKGELSR